MLPLAALAIGSGYGNVVGVAFLVKRRGGDEGRGEERGGEVKREKEGREGERTERLS